MYYIGLFYNFREVVRNIKNVIIRNVFRWYEYREIDKLKYYDNKQRYSCCGYYEQKILQRNAANGFKKVVFTKI